MSPSDVSHSYDLIAGRWAESGFDRQNGKALHARALQFVTHKSTALDVGCGSSGRFIELLTGHGFEVEGLDISAEMILLARERHPKIVFHHANLVEWTPPQAYDFITAWDSVWHVPQAWQEAVWSKLMNALTLGGVMILTTGGLDEPGEVQNEAMGVPMYHATPGLPALTRLIDTCGCVIRHLEYDQWPEKHLVVVVQRL